MPVLLEASWPRIKRMEVKGAAFGVAVKYMPERPSHMGEDGQFDFEQSRFGIQMTAEKIPKTTVRAPTTFARGRNTSLELIT
ncbi:hypothetical protein SNOG_10450 [Parastagonospora nodorum SN15]|uniref:Uncharacterized protein n=1 Tax=Phaeosphaeria nodorum (strain SN15 / ATCC MYA-4574 / FGSC 10173) TaxID=321614 RepID=Q0UCR4_PHANO|nr:hypothetical protein SNOG_10450 [Parastagonospora nodorum SN15]EAT81844.1 hypothetical protein SNOG_10450 [Parastagonospora nodorum SN15]